MSKIFGIVCTRYVGYSGLLVGYTQNERLKVKNKYDFGIITLKITCD